MRDVEDLKIRTTINEKDITIINKQLEEININTTWILRIVIGAIIMAILEWIFKNGIQYKKTSTNAL